MVFPVRFTLGINISFCFIYKSYAKFERFEVFELFEGFLALREV